MQTPGTPKHLYENETGDATIPGNVPTLTAYWPAKPSGSAIIVLPGGGYFKTADHEGEPVAKWLNNLGIAAFVLKYRHAPQHQHPAPLKDAARAIRFVRAHTPQSKLDPNRIGILGFSAGGHLASTLATHFDFGDPSSLDPLGRVSCRPDVSILLYPVITMDSAYTHAGSRENLLGKNPSQELVAQLSNENQVTAKTPPAFIFHTADDEAVPVENAMLYASSLRRAGVPFELHIYEHGHHGVGLALDDPILSTWTDRCAAWLKSHAF